MAVYIIEHLEPRVWKWCLIEYRHISQLVGRRSLWFTNVKRKNKNLSRIGRVFHDSVSKLNLKNACILDPEAKKTLAPKEAKKFKYFIFGGILGDYPPKKRTAKELTKFLGKNIARRNIGRKQFSTDNAVYVVNQIQKGRPFSKLKFQDTLEIHFNKIESLILPYRYTLVGKNNEPFISKELLKFLSHKRV